MAKTITIFDQIVPLDTTYLNMVFVEEVTSAELEKVRSLTELRHLNASSHLLHDEHLEIIGTLEQLEMLDLVMTEITDQGLQKIGDLKNLDELRLKDNPQLTDNCIPYLATLQALKSVHLGNTAVSIKGVKRLLSDVALETIILDATFDKFLNPLKLLSLEYPKLQILLKGIGTIVNGELDQ